MLIVLAISFPPAGGAMPMAMQDAMENAADDSSMHHKMMETNDHDCCDDNEPIETNVECCDGDCNNCQEQCNGSGLALINAVQSLPLIATNSVDLTSLQLPFSPKQSPLIPPIA